MNRLFASGVLLAVLAFNSYAGTFSDNFSTGLNPADWSIFYSQASYTVDSTGGNVVLRKTAPTSGNQVVNIVLNMAAIGGSISGDFSTQIDFSNAVIGPNVDQVQFDSQYANGSLFFDVYDLSSGRNVHVWNGSSVNNPMSETATSGTFAISRTGSTVTGYFNGTPIYSESISSDLSYLDFRLESQPNAANDSASVTFDNFSLTAGSVPEPATLSIVALGSAAALIRRRKSA